ncbi:RNA methyltransferase [Chryseobacterium manosquense]|uniref:RNA methyltransferase n=1 Tax=Chryseobacterium manosquense TaxID=2754694 RepID=A0A7H1DYI0_9FLAO|nr:RNA methyltransferase [Chryseobacterium manosquense]QNS42038.1 RNA methyltransferase [Chryseobacterium manosquense]
MLTAHKIKILQSLDKKKFRQKYNLFLVEGNKTIKEIPLSRYKIQEIFTINPSELGIDGVKIIEISDSELKKISFLQHPKDSVAVCELLEPKFLADVPIQLVLDGIQDPGNLGTIIRLADWFGIEQIICSEDTVDFYNPKVIQASMGSFLRVNITYQNIENYLQNSTAAIIGTDMDGENFYQFDFPEKFNLILGNEGNGIRPNIEELLTHKITIPRFGKSKSTESLNVSMAAGIILGQIFSEK